MLPKYAAVLAERLYLSYSGTMRALVSEEFESCPRSEYRLGFLTRDKGFLEIGDIPKSTPFSP
ncbi:hypothetical protein E2C01_049281 [Portunus trituberculatus]|uniref:Uncharacterized protein n=1 Tax=Portunus trituberculatus TaxID=210409 RepID=A0A5B7GDU1_PORTR|nr:hypothetical protein [Portunus trituberculatus]